MKTVLLTLCVSCFAWHLPAQIPVLKIFPDPTERPQYPHLETTYYIFPWSPNCNVLDTVVGGQIVDQGFYDGKLTVTIIWQDPVDSASARIVVSSSSACIYIAPDQVWEVTVIPFSTTLPTVTGLDYYYMGQPVSVALQADMYSYNGVLATSFEWEAPAGWYISTFSLGSGRVSLYIPATNALTEGCVRVRGKYPASGWTNWVDYCLHGTIPSPCPIQLSNAVLLCGDTVEHWFTAPNTVLPHRPEYYWSLPEYTWTVPPGWSILTSSPNNESFALVRSDGHTNGVVTLVGKAGNFTSATCEYEAIFLPTHPATVILGPNYVCQSGEFQLSLQPPDHSEITWQVTPLDPATPEVASPDHGSGEAVFQITDPTVSGYFRITYHIANACGAVNYQKDFFVGKPRFFDTLLDGGPDLTRLLCAGNHGFGTNVQGMRDPAVVWSASPGLSTHLQRDSFLFFLTPEEAGNCPIVTASATNSCGTSTLPLTVCPQPGCSASQLDLSVYPNPASLIVSLEVTSPDPVAEDYGLIENVEIFNHLGQLVTTWHELPTKRLVKAVVDLPEGLYTFRVTVWGQTIIKRLMVSRLF